MAAVGTVGGSDQKLEALIARVDQLAVLPHVVFKVLEITASGESSAADIEKAITVDPGFSSKVLVLANSASFGVPKRVTTIRDGVMYLGIRTVRNIALTVGVFDLFVGKTDRESLRRRAWWRHSIDTAVCSRWIARQTGLIPGEEAYTCGLLHLMGKTLLDRFGDADYDRVTLLGAHHDVPEVVAERRIYGCDHVQVAVEAARKWGLPPETQSGMNYLVPAGPDDAAPELRASLAIATRIAQQALDGANQGSAVMLPTWALQTLKLATDDSESLISEGVQAIIAARIGA